MAAIDRQAAGRQISMGRLQHGHEAAAAGISRGAESTDALLCTEAMHRGSRGTRAGPR